MIKNFVEHNIICEHCPIYDKYESPTSTILINSQNGSRTIVHSNKGMPEISLENFKNLNLNEYAWIHFEVRPQFEEMKKIIKYIRTYNDCNTDNKVPISIEIEKPRPELVELLDLGDVVFISKDFALANGYSDMVSAVNGLFSKLRPSSSIICPWGEKGAAVKMFSGAVVTSPAFSPKEIVSTLGAGDTFIAATILALSKGQDLTQAIEMGCKVAGAKCGMQNADGLSKLFPTLM